MSLSDTWQLGTLSASGTASVLSKEYVTNLKIRRLPVTVFYQTMQNLAS